MMNRSWFATLGVLAAFAAAQVESLNHRARHAAEEAAETGTFLCLCGGEAVHLCADHAEDAHPPDCAVCLAGTVLAGAPAAGPDRGLPPPRAGLRFFDQAVPSSAPDAGLSAPRGPPAL